MFTESPPSARLTEDLILSRKIIDASKKPSKPSQGLSPLTCVGQWISLASSSCGRVDIEAIFVTPSGHVVIILSSNISDVDQSSLISELSTWDCKTLDRIAADFALSSLGQAFTVCDLLAKHGRITFDQSSDVEASITDCLQSGSFSLFYFDDKKQ